jgi:hypothetical protein
MKHTKLLIGAALLATVTMTGVASAAASTTIIASSTPIDLQFDDGDATGVFNKTFSKSVTGRNFADQFTFTLTRASDVSFSFSSTKSYNQDLTFSSFGLYSADSALVKGIINNDGGGNESSLNNKLLGAGNYSIRVAGNVLGTKGGTYSGTLSVSPVPEPESWGMMALGLAGVGALARRKAKSQKSA